MSEFFEQSRYNSLKIANLVAVSLAILESIRVAGFISYQPSYILLLVLMLLPVVKSLTGSKTIISFPYVLFCIYLCFNVLITNPPSVFNSWERLLMFVILLSCVSPMISSRLQRYFRLRCLYIFICIMTILSAISCICYFFDINYFHNQYGLTDYVSYAGLFGGLFVHSMLLGPMAGISTCFLLWVYLRTRRKIFIVLIVLTSGGVLFSASRAALLATMVGCIGLFLLYFKKKSKAYKRLLFVVILLVLTAPMWDFSLDGISKKNQDIEELGKYGSRTGKFEARLAEFESSPILGIGFAAINQSGVDNYNIRTGSIEPGSSWLCTLSMTGIIGFLLVVYMIISTFKNAKNSHAPYASLVAALTIWFSVHLIFEGYIFASGNPLCFVFWLVIGVATDTKFYTKTM